MKSLYQPGAATSVRRKWITMALLVPFALCGICEASGGSGGTGNTTTLKYIGATIALLAAVTALVKAFKGNGSDGRRS